MIVSTARSVIYAKTLKRAWVALTSSGQNIKDRLEMSREIEPIHEIDQEVEESRAATQEPPRYQVVLLNDDYTPMDFVIELLQRFFRMNQEDATQVMLHVHTRGKGVCGTYTREIAETKVEQVNEYARENQHPLLSSMEKVG